MRRVYFAFWMKRILDPLMMKVYALLLALIGVVAFTSVPNVIQNMPHDSVGSILFGIYAFEHTQMPVQLFVVAGASFAFWLLFDLFHSLMAHSQHAPQRVSF
jgi:hypothetical protein